MAAVVIGLGGVLVVTYYERLLFLGRFFWELAC